MKAHNIKAFDMSYRYTLLVVTNYWEGPDDEINGLTAPQVLHEIESRDLPECCFYVVDEGTGKLSGLKYA